jgi:membrane-bound lytic murein transglycosylase F
MLNPRLTPTPLLWPCLCLLLALVGCVPTDNSRLAAVQYRGELVVLTRNSPTTFYEGAEGPTGFEYELAKAFAESLDVSLKMKSVERFADILPRIANHEADFAAAGITMTPTRSEQVRFAPHYQIIRQQVVHHMRTPAPANVAGLVGRQIEVVQGTSYIERLAQLKEKFPKLEWTAVANMETEELLQHVQDSLTEFTIADSNIVAINRQFNPELRIAFDLGEPEKLAWAFPHSEDNSLYDEAVRFIESMRASGKLSQLIEKHYGAATRFNPINIAVYNQKIQSDLPRFKPLFEETARRHLLDWRLLAAMSYQESYWNPLATSVTGVRGIMMLTENTARSLGVRDRLDPRQSIQGGGAYLRKMIDILPERIPEPDRTWMALASYNVGYGHLEDARLITQAQGADPDKWNDVKDRLPLLTNPAWYNKTRNGYARGYEPVEFVNRIRTYYDVLKKDDVDNRARNTTEVLRLRAPAL